MRIGYRYHSLARMVCSSSFFVVIIPKYLHLRSPSAKGEATRLEHTKKLLTHLGTFWKEVKASKGADEEVGCILCGDFNAAPSGSVYQHVISTPIPSTNLTLKSAYANYASASGTTPTPSKATPAGGRARRAGAKQGDNGSAAGEPPYTTYLPSSNMVVDYIFYAGGLTLTDITEIPPLAQGEGLPNQHLSSDHVYLAATFT